MTVFSLAEIYQDYGKDRQAIQNFLNGFSCAKNQDVENFLKNKALRFEESDNARTYLILSDNGEILAYFSLSFKEVMLINEKMSKSEVKQLDGISKNAERIRGFLIGQIGKNSAITENPVTLYDIFAHIMFIFSKAKQLIGGRAVILECQPTKKLIQLYQQHGFKTLPVVDDSEMLTLYQVL